MQTNRRRRRSKGEWRRTENRRRALLQTNKRKRKRRRRKRKRDGEVAEKEREDEEKTQQGGLGEGGERIGIRERRVFRVASRWIEIDFFFFLETYNWRILMSIPGPKPCLLLCFGGVIHSAKADEGLRIENSSRRDLRPRNPLRRRESPLSWEKRAPPGPCRWQAVSPVLRCGRLSLEEF